MKHKLEDLVVQAQTERHQVASFLKYGALNEAQTKLAELDATLAKISDLLDTVENALKDIKR